jgi:hypothetical protein
MAAPFAPAHPCGGFGRTALILGMIGIGLGVFTVRTWFVAVPLGLLTLMFGTVGLAAARGRLLAAGKSAVAGTIAGVITLALGAWGTAGFIGRLNDLTARLDGAPVVIVVTVPDPGPMPVAFRPGPGARTGDA